MYNKDQLSNETFIASDDFIDMGWLIPGNYKTAYKHARKAIRIIIQFIIYKELGRLLPTIEIRISQ